MGGYDYEELYDGHTMLALHRATGINHLILSVQWPSMPQSLVLDELHMLAEEVFPKVQRG